MLSSLHVQKWIRKAIGRFLFIALLVPVFFTVKAQPVTFSTGSYIIDLGAGYAGGIQNIDNGLRPYGMVYDMLKNYNVPIYGYVNPTKVKDGADLVYNGHVFRGGVFIIEKNYVSSTAQTALNQWFANTVGVNGKGKVVKYDVVAGQPLTLTPNFIFKSAPIWTLDLQNGDIAKGFFTHAGIPVTAYNEVLPSQLGACNDVFVMPHADPTWLTHSNLLHWNSVHKGAIWSGCHAASAVENMYNPANTSQQTNFLTKKVTVTGGNPNIKLPVPGSTAYAQNSLVLWGAHDDGSIPYLTNTVGTYTMASGQIASPSDPISQFMGLPDLASQNGSEQIFFPVKTGGWLPTTKIITWDPTPSVADVPGALPGKSDGPGAIIAYGRAFGDDNNGLVLYQAGHSINKGTTGDVAAMRAFFNFSFVAMLDKMPATGAVSGLPPGNIFSTFPTGQSYPLSITFSSPVGASIQSVTWTAVRTDNGAVAGSFSPNGTAASLNTTFTPNQVFGNDVPIVITATVLDECGRSTFESVTSVLTPSPRAPIANPATKTLSGNCFGSGDIVTFDLATVASDPDGDPITYSLGTTGLVPGVGTWSLIGSVVTFTPVPNFFGNATNTYTVCDNTSTKGYPPPDNIDLCASNNITFTLGNADANGCFPGSVYGLSASAGATTASSGGDAITNPANAEGLSDFDDGDDASAAATSAIITSGWDGTNTRFLRLDYGSLIPASAYDSIHVYFAGVTAATNTITVESSADNATWTALTLTGGVTTTGLERELMEAFYDFPAGGLRYIRVRTAAGDNDDVYVDAVELENWGCVSSLGQVVNDAFTVREDTPTDLDVLANDINPLNKAVTLSIITAPTHGMAVVNSDNTIRYQPTKDDENNDSFTYQACTEDGACLTATVTITKKADACAPGSYSPLDAVESSFILSPVKDSWYKEDGGGDDVQGGGTGATLEVGKKLTKRKRTIIQFNTEIGTGTGQLPAGASITSATLRIVKTGGDNVLLSLGAYKVIEGPANLAQDWTETQVTWKHRTKNTATFWSTAGGTINTSPYSTTNSPAANGERLFDLKSMAAEWYASASTNFGVVIGQTANVDKRHQFASRENGTTANRPTLKINYRVDAPCNPIPNYGPLAQADHKSTISDLAITFDPRTNDSDYEGNPLTITGVSNISAGIAGYTDTSITYTPATGTLVPRTEKLLYTISDGQGNTHQNWVYITINNAPPVLVNDTTPSVLSGTAVVVNVGNNDSDPESQTLSDALVTVLPQHGAVNVTGTTVTYTPFTFNSPGVESFVGTDSLTYQRCETTGGDECYPVFLCSTAKVYFNITNRPPVTAPKTANTGTCIPVNFTLAGSFSDPENQPLTVEITNGTEGPAGTWTFPKGTLVLNVDNSYTFTPIPGFPATPGTEYVVINYKVKDTYGDSSENTITIGVTNPPPNLAPIANPDNPTTNPAETIGLINQDLYIGVLDNDTDPENYELFINIPGGTGPNQIKQVYDGASVLAGTIEKTNNNKVLFKPAFNYVGTVSFQYQVCDILPPFDPLCNPAIPMCSYGDVTLQINNTSINTPIHLYGTVWYDVNNSAAGTLNNIYTAGENGTNASNTLYAYLINTSTNEVTAKVQVLPDGTYLLHADKDTNVTIFVSATDIAVSTVITPAQLPANITLPSGWAATSPLYKTFTTGELDLLGNDFGVQEPPIAGNGANSAINPGGTTQVTVPANTFTNIAVSSDPSPGTLTSVRITAFPTGATSIVVNGITYYNIPSEVAALTALIISTDASGNPLVAITVDPSFERDGQVTIPFKAIDNGNAESSNTGTAVMNFNCVTECVTYRTTKNGHWNDATVWEVQSCSGTWFAAPAPPVQGTQVNILHVIKQNVDFTIQNCALVLADNGSSKLIIEPNITLGFNGGNDGNAYFNNRPVVVRSTINGTGAIGTMLTNSKTSGDENVTLERFIPGVKRRWNLLTPGVVNGNTINTTTTLLDAWGDSKVPRVINSNNRAGSTVYPLGNPPGGKPENVPFPLYASNAAALVSHPLTSGYDPLLYTPYNGTIITGHRYTSGTQASPKGFDWWDELIIPAGAQYYITPTQIGTAVNTRTTPSSIRPYRPNAISDFGPERGTEWVSNGDINSVPGKGGRSIVQLTLNELDNGYLVFTRGDRRVLENWFDSTTLRPTGKIRTGEVLIPVYASATQNLTVVPNPYPAPVSLEKLYADPLAGNSNVMAGKAHVWDSKMAGSNGLGGWVALTRIDVNSWVAAPAVSADNPTLISSSQAFMVEGTASGGNLAFRENMKADIKSVEFTPFENETLAEATGVLLTNLNNRNSTTGALSVIDGVGALLNDKYSTATTDDNDVRKLFNFEGGKSLSILCGGVLLAFDAHPNPVTETTFPLQIGEFSQQAFAFTFTVRNLYKEGREAWLRDKYLNIDWPISISGPTQYNFEGNSDPNSIKADRFEIVFKQSEILPVTFTSINALEQGKNVKVTWSVATEENISHYEVEHSINGTQFEKAVKVEAKNISPAAYDWLHIQPGSGTHFYRVRAISTEGLSRLTKVVKVTLGYNQPGFRVFPTVVSNTLQVTLQLISLEKGRYNLQVTDMAGRVISATTIDHNGGSASTILQLPAALASGKYLVRLNGKSGTFIEPVVKD